MQEFPIFLSLEKSGVEKTSQYRGQKNIFLKIEFFDFASEMEKLPKFLISMLFVESRIIENQERRISYCRKAFQ